MENKMKLWGIGPALALLSTGYGVVMLAVSWYFYPAFQIDVVPYWLMSGVGIALMVTGVPFLVVSATTVTRAFNAGRLVTGGIFRWCRHPLYASWVICIVPGFFFLVNSWIGLTTPVFMYLIVRRLVRKEELYLESVFGSEYLEYKSDVPFILPYGSMK